MKELKEPIKMYQLLMEHLSSTDMMGLMPESSMDLYYEKRHESW